MPDSNEKSRVQVSIRIRPTVEAEKGKEKVVARGVNEKIVSIDDDHKGQKSYQFDNVFIGDQRSLYETIGKPMLEEAYKGFNVCLFAYGQTGSGKTHSLLGTIGDGENQGIAPRFVRDLFDEAQQRVEEDSELTIKVSLSMIEVYMEKVRDLLAPRQRGQEPESLEIHEDANKRVYVKGAGMHPVLSSERMMELLKRGNANRQTAETKMNETSSRSHAIIQIFVSQEYASVLKKDLECTVSLVDLAGSERQTKTETTGQQFEEAKKINHSLLMLGRALNSFSDRKGGDAYISLRESKLTRLLSESFGGNSKTWMLATISPTAYNLTETISTLDYASNAMAITNKAKVNSALRGLELKELKAVVAHLEKELEALANVKESEELMIAELVEERNALLRAVQSARAQGAAKSRLQESLDSINLGNIALRRRVDAASHKLIWYLDNEASVLFFKGACGISLQSVLMGKRCSFLLGLQTENNLPTRAKLQIQLFPIDQDVVEGGDPMDMVGRSLRFCLHIVGAEGIPQPFIDHTFCKVSLRYDEEDRGFTTGTAEKTANPKWGLVKQFEIPNLTSDIIACFCNQHLFTFEVFGFCT